MEITDKANAEKSAWAVSPLMRALQYVSRRTTSDVRVHVSKRRLEKDPMSYALEIFDRYALTRSANRDSVLIYLNLSTRRFAIVADEGIHKRVGQRYWDELSVHLREDLQSTYFENALGMTVFTIGLVLEKYFPIRREGAESRGL